MQCLGLSLVLTYELFKMCFISDYFLPQYLLRKLDGLRISAFLVLGGRAVAVVLCHILSAVCMTQSGYYTPSNIFLSK